MEQLPDSNQKKASRTPKDEYKQFLIKALLGSGALKAGQILFLLAATIVLARSLGPEGYGIYAFSFSLATLLAIPVQVGLPNLAVREVAKYHLENRWGCFNGLIKRSNQVIIIASFILAICVALVIWVVIDDINEAKLYTIAWAMLLVPLIALGKLRGAILRGLHKVVQGQLPEMLIRPGLLVLLLVIAWYMGDMTPDGAMLIHALAAGVAFIVGIFLLLKAIPREARGIEAEFETRAWVSSILPLSLISGMQIVINQTDIVMLGIMSSSADVGVYRVAVQGATFVALSLMIVNMVISPQISRLFHAGEQKKLQKLITWSSRLIFITSLPAGLVLIFFASPILQFVFGDEYGVGANSLAILCAGQMVSAIMGSVGYLMMMTGKEKEMAKRLVLAAICNVVLNSILIPLYGMEGAAVSTAISVIILNFMLYAQVRKHLLIDSLAIKVVRIS